MLEYRKEGDIVLANGDNFEFRRVMDKCKFKFTGKVASRRQLRDAVKAIEKACK